MFPARSLQEPKGMLRGMAGADKHARCWLIAKSRFLFHFSYFISGGEGWKPYKTSKLNCEAKGVESEAEGGVGSKRGNLFAAVFALLTWKNRHNKRGRIDWSVSNSPRLLFGRRKINEWNSLVWNETFAGFETSWFVILFLWHSFF